MGAPKYKGSRKSGNGAGSRARGHRAKTNTKRGRFLRHSGMSEVAQVVKKSVVVKPKETTVKVEDVAKVEPEVVKLATLKPLNSDVVNTTLADSVKADDS